MRVQIPPPLLCRCAVSGRAVGLTFCRMGNGSSTHAPGPLKESQPMTRVKQQLRKPLCRGSRYVRLALHARAVFSLLPPPLAGPSLQPWASSSVV